jgi:hypothetical protein
MLFAQGTFLPILYLILVLKLIYFSFVLTDLVKKQIPEQAQRLGISEQEVIKNVMLKDTVDGEFTTPGTSFTFFFIFLFPLLIYLKNRGYSRSCCSFCSTSHQCPHRPVAHC